MNRSRAPRPHASIWAARIIGCAPPRRIASVVLSVLLLLACAPKHASGQVVSYAELDPLSLAMVAEAVPTSELLAPAHTAYFDAPISPHLLLVHLNDEPPQKLLWQLAWMSYAERFGYGVTSVGPADVEHHLSALSPALRAALTAAWRTGDRAVVQRGLGWALLAQGGGVLVDPTLWPPQHRGAYVALERLMPLRGLVAVAAPRAHNVRDSRSGLALDDALVLAAPGHPVIVQMLRALPDNLSALSRVEPSADVAYTAGRVLLTRSLSGAVTVLPHGFLSTFGMDVGATR